jgi:hypothetical protein
MTVILKKDEKVASVLNALPENYSQNDFILKFRELYPTDWDKIVKNYNDHMRKAKPGKIVPMPKPEQYLINALNVWLNK